MTVAQTLGPWIYQINPVPMDPICDPFRYYIELWDGAGCYYYSRFLFPNLETAQRFLVLCYERVRLQVEKRNATLRRACRPQHYTLYPYCHEAWHAPAVYGLTAADSLLEAQIWQWKHWLVLEAPVMCPLLQKLELEPQRLLFWVTSSTFMYETYQLVTCDETSQDFLEDYALYPIG